MLFFIIQNPKMQGLLMLKGIYIKKDQRDFCARKSEKISIVIKNVIWSDKTLMHKAERPSKCFFTILSHIIRLSR